MTTSRPLTAHEKNALRPYIGAIDLDNAILHGRVPWYLSKRFAGIVRGHHVYFRAGAYDPYTARGLALLGHELTHVAQYRKGMTAFSYLVSALRGYLNSKYEKEAFAVQAQIERDLSDPRTVRDVIDVGNVRDVSNVRNVSDLSDVSNVHDVHDVLDVRNVPTTTPSSPE